MRKLFKRSQWLSLVFGTKQDDLVKCMVLHEHTFTSVNKLSNKNAAEKIRLENWKYPIKQKNHAFIHHQSLLNDRQVLQRSQTTVGDMEKPTWHAPLVLKQTKLTNNWTHSTQSKLSAQKKKNIQSFLRRRERTFPVTLRIR